jgi:hypothetical protein
MAQTAQASVIYTNPNEREALFAGVLAGVAGLLVFLVIHDLWILPIWFIRFISATADRGDRADHRLPN